MTNPNRIMTLIKKHPNVPGNDGWYLQIHPDLIKKLGWNKPTTLVVMEVKDNKLFVEKVQDGQ